MVGDPTLEDIEGSVEATYRRAGLEPDEAAHPIDIAEALLGEGACVRCTRGRCPELLRSRGFSRSLVVFFGAAHLWRAYCGSSRTRLGHFVLGLEASEVARDAFAGVLQRRAAPSCGRPRSPEQTGQRLRRFGCTDRGAALR